MTFFIVYLILEISNLFKLFCTLELKTQFSDYKNKWFHIYIYFCFDFALLCKFSSNRSGTAQVRVGRFRKSQDEIKCDNFKFEQDLY